MRKFTISILLAIAGILHSEKIIPVSTGFVNVYLIKAENSWVMVDTGMPGSEEKILKVMGENGIKPGIISHIILTHGHGDHIANLKYYKDLTGAQVVCHSNIKQYLIDGEDVKAIPRIFTGKVLDFFFKSKELEGITPDITFDDDFDLSPLGLMGSIIYTPGHSIGSITIILDSGQVLIGDQLRGKPGKYNLGMFFDNEEIAIESLKKISEYNITEIYLSHGKIIKKDDLLEAIK